MISLPFLHFPCGGYFFCSKKSLLAITQPRIAHVIKYICNIRRCVCIAARTSVKATVDFATQLAEKQSAKEATAAEIASIIANIYTLKADLKAKKTEMKSIDKEIARIEAKKVKAETKAAESAKKAEAADVLKKLLASDVSADDILAKLK